jgi:hypothetical protein
VRLDALLTRYRENRSGEGARHRRIGVYSRSFAVKLLRRIFAGVVDYSAMPSRAACAGGLFALIFGGFRGWRRACFISAAKK